MKATPSLLLEMLEHTIQHISWLLSSSLFLWLITLLRATTWSLPKTILIALLFRIHTSWFTPIQNYCIENPGNSCSQWPEKICPSQPSFSFCHICQSSFSGVSVDLHFLCVASSIHFRLSFRVGQWHWLIAITNNTLLTLLPTANPP